VLRMSIVVFWLFYVECLFTNCVVLVLCVGRYGLICGVFVLGGGCGVGFCELVGGGSVSGSVVSMLIVWILFSLEVLLVL